MFNIVGAYTETNEQTVTLSQKTISEVCEAVITAMISGLPEEARTLEVFDHVLDESKAMLRNKIIELK